MGRAILTLLCLWSFIMTVTPLTDKQVQTATEYIKKNFNPAEKKQYSYAAVFSDEECKSLSPNKKNLKILQNEKKNDIAEALEDNNIIYIGNQMVLATYKVGKKGNIQSEYRLLFPPTKSGVSPVQQLVDSNPNGACAIFYTFNSPCVGKCANTTNGRNIIQKLSAFNTYKNNKAYVYNKLYYLDIKKEKIWADLTAINNNMDVFRCSNGKCLNCFEKKQNKLKNKDTCLN